MAFYLERCNDGVLVRNRDGLVDVLSRVAHIDEEAYTHKQLVVNARLEVNRLLVQHLTTKFPTAGGRRGVACGGQEVTTDE